MITYLAADKQCSCKTY